MKNLSLQEITRLRGCIDALSAEIERELGCISTKLAALQSELEEGKEAQIFRIGERVKSRNTETLGTVIRISAHGDAVVYFDGAASPIILGNGRLIRVQ